MTELKEMLAIDLISAHCEVRSRIAALNAELKAAKREEMAIDTEMQNRANRPLPHTDQEQVEVAQPMQTKTPRRAK